MYILSLPDLGTKRFVSQCFYQRLYSQLPYHDEVSLGFLADLPLFSH